MSKEDDNLAKALDNLKECPFCGSQDLALSLFQPGVARVACMNCRILGPMVKFWDTTIKAADACKAAAECWNSRPPKGTVRDYL